MKKVITLMLAAGLILAATTSYGIDFNTKGRWEMFFQGGEHTFLKPSYAKKAYSADTFEAAQRLRIQVDAIASDSLSGTVMFEIGSSTWGKAGHGAALGTDGTSVEVKRAYLDWVIPQTTLSLRMGLMGLELPNAAGGSTIMNDEVAGIVASYKFNDTATLTAIWARPYNDNYTRDQHSEYYIPSNDASNLFDNVDLFALSLPLSFDGIKITPWLMYGAMGKNAGFDQISSGNLGSRMFMQQGLFPRSMYSNGSQLNTVNATNTYGSLFWAGIPIKVSLLDPWNFEFDFNYGYSEGWGSYTDYKGRRADMMREGFVVKGLAEYKMDWGTPGLFAWYGSGDDGNTRNGSESMPSLSPLATFSTFGMGAYGVEYSNLMSGEVVTRTYAGTWGIGAQLRDMYSLDNLSHTVRAIYYRGTNDPAMAKATGPMGWNSYAAHGDEPVGWGLYLTQNDYLVEFNVDSTWKIYDNLEAVLELAYIVNGVDKDTWKWQGDQKADAWKAGLSFIYNF